MATDTLIEQRLSALEQAVSELQQKISTQPPAQDWLRQMIGAFKDEPAFDEVIAYGKAFREADRPAQDNGDAS
jgi:hypothetical protein